MNRSPRRRIHRPAVPRNAPALVATWATLLVLVLAAPADGQVREVVILQTNDFESAIDPVEAFWMEGSPELGGAAHIKTMIDGIRQREAESGVPVFLFDSGDMFTGLLSRLTYGEIMMEMMITLGYDAMGLGNHEFDYGSDNFLRQSWRVPFPVLSANTFYAGTDIPYLRPHAIVEKDGLRIGVIGIIGRDAMSVVVPSLVDDLEFRDPEPWLRRSVQTLAPDVDLIVVLAHQGKTGPMQSDQEADPSVWRDFDEDIALAGAVDGIDVFLGGHAHRGIDPPYVHPETGTIISQTFGHGTRLTFLRLRVDTETGEVVEHEGGLVVPYSAEHEPDPVMAAKMDAYRERHADEIATVVGELQQRLVRKYRTESSLGSFVADVIREAGDAPVGLTNAGGLRADLPPGEVTVGDVRDALPFLNTVVVVEMTGRQLMEVIEQGLTLERGMIQVSGIRAVYDPSRPRHDRLLELEIAGEPVDPEATYRVATNNFMAEGGDLYQTFVGLEWLLETEGALGDLVIEYLGRTEGPLPPPSTNRLVPTTER